MGKILPILLALIGTGAGIGAGIMFAPAPKDSAEMASEDCVPVDGAAQQVAEKAPAKPPEEPEAETEFVRLNNQFIVPIVGEERVEALIVMSISLEVTVGTSAAVFDREPKLRDEFLRVFFDHANIGGFSGNFTRQNVLNQLREQLRDVARKQLGSDLHDVLITEINRQDAV